MIKFIFKFDCLQIIIFKKSGWRTNFSYLPCDFIWADNTTINSQLWCSGNQLFIIKQVAILLLIKIYLYLVALGRTKQ